MTTDKFKIESNRVRAIVFSIFGDYNEYNLLGSSCEDMTSEIIISDSRLSLTQILEFNLRLPDYSMSIESFDRNIIRIFFFKK
jgi:hypothetical protein